jgi:predicted nucleic acid-binding protein
MAPLRLSIIDACVLIDFLEADETILTLAAHHIGDVYVPTPVLLEVSGLDRARALSLALKLYDPTPDMLAQAIARRGSLSFQDHLCLAIARAEGWTCISNDKALRAACQADGISVVWGLQVLTDLVARRALSASAAAALGRAIADANKRMSADVLKRFIAKLDVKT